MITVVLPLVACQRIVRSPGIALRYRFLLPSQTPRLGVEIFGLGVDCRLLHQFIIRAPVATVHEIPKVRGPKATLEGVVGCPIVRFWTPRVLMTEARSVFL
ncbi:unnamed protein product [Prunus armeniaca]